MLWLKGEHDDMDKGQDVIQGMQKQESLISCPSTDYILCFSSVNTALSGHFFCHCKLLRNILQNEGGMYFHIMIRFLKCQQNPLRKKMNSIYSTWCYRSHLWRILWLCWHQSGWFLRCRLVYKLKYLPWFTAVLSRVGPELPIWRPLTAQLMQQQGVLWKLLFTQSHRKCRLLEKPL